MSACREKVIEELTDELEAAAVARGFNDDDLEALEVFLENFWEEETVEGTLDAFQDVYEGLHRSAADWVEEFMEDCGTLSSLPENLHCYFDFEALACVMETNGEILVEDSARQPFHVHVFRKS